MGIAMEGTAIVMIMGHKGPFPQDGGVSPILQLPYD